MALEIEALAGQFGLAIADGGIAPDILLGAIERLEGRTDGGVRDIARALEREVTDGFIEARAAKAKAVRLSQTGAGIQVHAIDEPTAKIASAPYAVAAT